MTQPKRGARPLTRTDAAAARVDRALSDTIDAVNAATKAGADVVTLPSRDARYLVAALLVATGRADLLVDAGDPRVGTPYDPARPGPLADRGGGS